MNTKNIRRKMKYKLFILFLPAYPQPVSPHKPSSALMTLVGVTVNSCLDEWTFLCALPALCDLVTLWPQGFFLKT